MSLRSGERQVATKLEDIRADHVARYQWAAKMLPAGSHVIDLGCGIGYGAKILAEAGHKVDAFDADQETIEFAKSYFGHPEVRYFVAQREGMEFGRCDAAVAFEIIEHVEDPKKMLANLNCELLLASVPNEDVFPYRHHDFHHRHYTPDEFRRLLAGVGFGVESFWGQVGPHSDVEPNIAGRTVLAVARRGFVRSGPHVSEQPQMSIPVPDHVVILGLGPSLEAYVDRVKRIGSRRAFADQVWGINAVCDVVQCDLGFHMDDVRIQEARAAAAPESNIANMVGWLKTHPGPIFTSRPHPDYPGLIEYPLQDVINSCTTHYFNGTAAYAVAYAIHLGVKKISLFGCDFTWANSHHAERGRACLEFWLGVAWARGIDVGVPERTTLLDMIDGEKAKFYGYDTLDVAVDHLDGAARVTLTPLPDDRMPTAEEIEQRYNHAQHPNSLVRK